MATNPVNAEKERQAAGLFAGLGASTPAAGSSLFKATTAAPVAAVRPAATMAAVAAVIPASVPAAKSRVDVDDILDLSFASAVRSFVDVNNLSCSLFFVAWCSHGFVWSLCVFDVLSHVAACD
jgi:hypothetical protein